MRQSEVPDANQKWFERAVCSLGDIRRADGQEFDSNSWFYALSTRTANNCGAAHATNWAYDLVITGYPIDEEISDKPKLRGFRGAYWNTSNVFCNSLKEIKIALIDLRQLQSGIY